MGGIGSELNMAVHTGRPGSSPVLYRLAQLDSRRLGQMRGLALSFVLTSRLVGER